MSETGNKRESVAAPVFTTAEHAVLNALMDLMIPASRDGRMPSARALALYADTAGLCCRDAALLRDGLREIEARAQAAHGTSFAQLQVAGAMAVVDELRAQHPEFIHAFTLNTTARYLKHATVMPLIGLEPRPPWPKGHVVAEGDLSLIEMVRKRPKIYRQV